MLRKALLVGVIAAAALPASAFAADQDVYNAWISRDADFARLGKAYTKGVGIWKHSNFNRPRPALRAIRKTIKLIKVVRPAIEAQAPSSTAGDRGKAAALDSINLMRLELIHARRAIVAGTHGRRAVARREFKRVASLFYRSESAEDAARDAFTEAGVPVEPR